MRTVPNFVLVSLFVLPSSTGAQIVIGPGPDDGATESTLAAHWTFDGHLEDRTNKNNGVAVGYLGFTTDAEGEAGSALALPGEALVNIVRRPGSLLPAVDSPSEYISVAMWVKGLPQDRAIVYSESSTTTTPGPLFTIATKDRDSIGRLRVYVRDDAGREFAAISKRVVFDGTWHHVTVVRVRPESGHIGVTLYVDGLLAEIETVVDEEPVQLTLNQVAIGGVRRTSNCCFFRGAIDDVRVYVRRVYPSEVLRWLGICASWCLEGSLSFNAPLVGPATDGCPWGSLGRIRNYSLTLDEPTYLRLRVDAPDTPYPKIMVTTESCGDPEILWTSHASGGFIEWEAFMPAGRFVVSAFTGDTGDYVLQAESLVRPLECLQGDLNCGETQLGVLDADDCRGRPPGGIEGDEATFRVFRVDLRGGIGGKLVVGNGNEANFLLLLNGSGTLRSAAYAPEGTEIDLDAELYYVAAMGTPGSLYRLSVESSFCPPIATSTFLRGDGNDDGTVDISDPVFNLEVQFLGEHDPGCLAALDTNGDGTMDISDPIYNLEHQFLGKPAPPPPHPGCGPESLPAGKALPCETQPGSCP